VQFGCSVGELEKSVGDSRLPCPKSALLDTELRSNKTKNVKEMYAGYYSNGMCRWALEALEVYV